MYQWIPTQRYDRYYKSTHKKDFVNLTRIYDDYPHKKDEDPEHEYTLSKKEWKEIHTVYSEMIMLYMGQGHEYSIPYPRLGKFRLGKARRRKNLGDKQGIFMATIIVWTQKTFKMKSIWKLRYSKINKKRKINTKIKLKHKHKINKYGGRLNKIR